jgi:hypothetical protein
MPVSSTYNGFSYDRQNNRLDVYFRGTRVTSFSASGVDLSPVGATLPANQRTGYIPLPLTGVREIGANDIPNTATNAGGVLAKNTTPILERVNGATDKALRITWAANDVDEIVFPSFVYPPDLDDTAPVLVNLVVAKDTNTNTTTNLAVSYFEGIGDTNAGTSTAAFSVSTLATYSVTIAASDVGASPAVATIGLTPAAHANDAIRLFGAYVSYTRKSS